MENPENCYPTSCTISQGTVCQRSCTDLAAASTVHKQGLVVHAFTITEFPMSDVV